MIENSVPGNTGIKGKGFYSAGKMDEGKLMNEMLKEEPERYDQNKKK